MNKPFHYGLAIAGAAALAVGVAACGGGSDDPIPVDPLKEAPQSIRMTWFGITNWHYQVGKIGIMLDGETLNAAVNAASVTKAINALKRTGTVDVLLIGHDHGDHSNQIPEWAKQTGKQVYAPKTVCTKLVAAGVPAAQCTTLLGGESIKLDAFVTMRPVRWVHSVDCGELSNGTGGPETFGFLITAQTPDKDKVLNFYVSDSGAGASDLTTPRVAEGITYGSPLSNLDAAMKAAKLTSLDIWQGGPESRVINQARIVVPAFDVKTFMPHHLNSRANDQSRFLLTYGMHYAYKLEDQPKLKQFLESSGVPQVYPTNYFDAWNYDKAGIKKVENAAMKADYGLPADGPGPGVQGPNPRAGSLECTND